ncbi:potassium channel family protein [Actinoplanes teichomyceticus]|uniref:Trk system potassium uptake protein TrkA n=1 Tax=Actinoplanes teichomyceticus TaxID=1867 RepID=A0A561VM22_ACTTI|nr:TrkA family potassium uptake protein [Actinoplanes teichomyceticus]TWG12666.1 trk system potassium uptake protein TrkA [Actinoplanes teichomyceticus]GIF13399.1 potassium transporter [Actinoplanes teichomyceticus]
MARKPVDHRIVVLGLGRFGGSLAAELVRRGWEVTGIDVSAQVVQGYADLLSHTAIANTTDEQSLRQLGVPEVTHAVVGVGTDLEASILTTALLADLGVPNIWAKAISRQHARILERVGAHHVVLPEHEMGERVAHLVTGHILNFIEFEDDYALVKTRAPQEAVDRTLADSALRARYGVTVVSIKRPGEEFTYATADTTVYAGDILIIAGKTRNVEAFAGLV